MPIANFYELRKFLCHIFDFFIRECKTKKTGFFFPGKQKIWMFIIKQCMIKYLLTILIVVIDNVFLFLFIITFYQIFGTLFSCTWHEDLCGQ